METLPANLMAFGACIWGLVLLLKAVTPLIGKGKAVPSGNGNGNSNSLRPVVTQVLQPAASDSVGSLSAQLDGLRDDVRDIKDAQKEHGKTLGEVRERLGKLEGAREAGLTGTGKHKAVE